MCRCPSHNCSGHGECSSVDGSCLCFTNWTTAICNQSTAMIYNESIPSSEPNQERKPNNDSIPSSEPYKNYIPSSEPNIEQTQNLNMDVASTSSEVTSQLTASVHVHTNHFTTVGLGCTSGNDTSHNWLHNNYLTPGLLLVTVLLILLHIVVCFGLRARNVAGKTAHINDTLLKRKRRKKRKRRTQMAQESSSSSDCSI